MGQEADMTDCRFCDDYKLIRERSRNFNKIHNKDPDRTFNLRSRIEIAIVERTWRYGGNGNYINRAGTYSCGSYPVNYCPVCGRKVK